MCSISGDGCLALVSNATRGRLAEFIVAAGLKIDTSGVRDEWAASDLDMPPVDPSNLDQWEFYVLETSGSRRTHT